MAGLAAEDRRLSQLSDHALDHKEGGAGLDHKDHTCYILDGRGDACGVRELGGMVVPENHDHAESDMHQVACP